MIKVCIVEGHYAFRKNDIQTLLYLTNEHREGRLLSEYDIKVRDIPNLINRAQAAEVDSSWQKLIKKGVRIGDSYSCQDVLDEAMINRIDRNFRESESSEYDANAIQNLLALGATPPANYQEKLNSLLIHAIANDCEAVARAYHSMDRAIASIQNNRAKQLFQVLVVPACQLSVTFNAAIALIGFDSVQGKAPQNGEVLSPMPGVYLASIL